MHVFFENWWERTPAYVRIGLFVATVAGMLLGGAADAYWE
jgi:membrane-associated PAP2 superfamily phosphatase